MCFLRRLRIESTKYSSFTAPMKRQVYFPVYVISSHIWRKQLASFFCALNVGRISYLLFFVRAFRFVFCSVKFLCSCSFGLLVLHYVLVLFSMLSFILHIVKCGSVNYSTGDLRRLKPNEVCFRHNRSLFLFCFFHFASFQREIRTMVYSSGYNAIL